MSEPLQSPQRRLLQAAAYIAVVAWGIRAASHILYLVLIALLFAYVFRGNGESLKHTETIALGLSASGLKEPPDFSRSIRGKVLSFGGYCAPYCALPTVMPRADPQCSP
jgi:hypothetical protein